MELMIDDMRKSSPLSSKDKTRAAWNICGSQDSRA